MVNGTGDGTTIACYSSMDYGTDGNRNGNWNWNWNAVVWCLGTGMGMVLHLLVSLSQRALFVDQWRFSSVLFRNFLEFPKISFFLSLFLFLSLAWLLPLNPNSPTCRCVLVIHRLTIIHRHNYTTTSTTQSSCRAVVQPQNLMTCFSRRLHCVCLVTAPTTSARQVCVCVCGCVPVETMQLSPLYPLDHSERVRVGWRHQTTCSTVCPRVLCWRCFECGGEHQIFAPAEEVWANQSHH